MRLVESVGGEARSEAKLERLADKRQTLPRSENRVWDLLFDSGCFECNRMAAIPQGAFAAVQVRKNFKRLSAAKYEKQEEEQKAKGDKNYGFTSKVLQEGREPTPLKYNSKLMNSIWGLYNRYSVHNFKKIDANEPDLLAEAWGALSPGSKAEAVVGAASAAGAGR